jgi:hypothetical protein
VWLGEHTDDPQSYLTHSTLSLLYVLTKGTTKLEV